jgi:hypothetical protein
MQRDALAQSDSGASNQFNNFVINFARDAESGQAPSSTSPETKTLLSINQNAIWIGLKLEDRRVCDN